MRLAASNIAWSADDDAAAAEILASLGFEGIEIAPTRVWPSPLATSAAERLAFRREWEARELPVVAMQALVFGRPDLVLFGEPAAREALATHLRGMIDLGADLGAGTLVFGSPKNRLRGSLGFEQALEIAAPFFRALGEYAAARGTALCVEANPPEYGCDFVTRAEEAADLVTRAASPGFGLHLDAGGMHLTGGAESSIRRLAAGARHFHVSEPGLAPVGSSSADHRSLAAALAAVGYRGWASVEMRTPEGPRPLEVLERALERAAAAYRRR
jgi:sugar phosphate isomerase/epimerase